MLPVAKGSFLSQWRRQLTVVAMAEGVQSSEWLRRVSKRVVPGTFRPPTIDLFVGPRRVEIAQCSDAGAVAVGR
jgi:hypothetical protein